MHLLGNQVAELVRVLPLYFWSDCNPITPKHWISSLLCIRHQKSRRPLSSHTTRYWPRTAPSNTRTSPFCSITKHYTTFASRVWASAIRPIETWTGCWPKWWHRRPLRYAFTARWTSIWTSSKQIWCHIRASISRWLHTRHCRPGRNPCTKRIPSDKLRPVVLSRAIAWWNVIRARVNTWPFVCCTGAMWCRRRSTTPFRILKPTSTLTLSIGVRPDSKLA